MELDEVNRKLQQTQQSVTQRAKNKTVQEYRKDARHEGRTISSTQARHELKLREIRQNELNKAVNEALQNATPKAASDPNGFLGRPQEVKELSPEKIPYIVLPEKPKDNTGSPYPNTVTKNLGDGDLETGESKAQVLKEGQLTVARRLYAKADSGLVLDDTTDDAYIEFDTKNLAPPEAPFVIDYGDSSTTAETSSWNREPEDPDVDGVEIRVFTRYTNELSAYDTFTTADGKTASLVRTYGFFRDMLFDKHGCLVSISGETRVTLSTLLELSGP